MMFIRLFNLITLVLHDMLSMQHYILPPHHCLSAQICNHTGKALCGTEKNEKHMRMFLDECDMFEYNCDNHKAYTSTELFRCTQTPETTTAILQALQSKSIEVNKTTNEITKSSLPELINVTKATVTETTKFALNLTTETLTTVTTLSTTINTTRNSSEPTRSNLDLNISQAISTSIQSLDTSIPTMDDKNVTDTTSLITTAITPIKTTAEITTEMTTKMSTIDDKYTTNATKLTLTTCTGRSPNITTSHIKEKSDCCSTTQSSKEDSVKTTLTEATLTTINEKNNTKHFEIPDTTSTHQSVATLVNCEYPKHCDRPRTWEVTAKGETRDFYQILKARYGNRVKILRDTTHWPRRMTTNLNDIVDNFQFGRHNEGEEID